MFHRKQYKKDCFPPASCILEFCVKYIVSFHDASNEGSISLTIDFNLALTLWRIPVKYIVLSASDPAVTSNACESRFMGIESQGGFFILIASESFSGRTFY